MTRPHRTLNPTPPGGTWALAAAIAVYLIMLGYALAISKGWLG